MPKKFNQCSKEKISIQKHSPNAHAIAAKHISSNTSSHDRDEIVNNCLIDDNNV